MNKARLMKIILGPVVSEKSANASDASLQFTFRVASDATKPEIAAAVEMMFEVDVTKVQVMKVKGKRKRFGRIMGRRKDWKKAIVRLKDGQDIDFAVGV